jgi:hypothetical protein
LASTCDHGDVINASTPSSSARELIKQHVLSFTPPVLRSGWAGERTKIAADPRADRRRCAGPDLVDGLWSAARRSAARAQIIPRLGHWQRRTARKAAE